MIFKYNGKSFSNLIIPLGHGNPFHSQCRFGKGLGNMGSILFLGYTCPGYISILCEPVFFCLRKCPIVIEAVLYS